MPLGAPLGASMFHKHIFSYWRKKGDNSLFRCDILLGQLYIKFVLLKWSILCLISGIKIQIKKILNFSIFLSSDKTDSRPNSVVGELKMEDDQLSQMLTR